MRCPSKAKLLIIPFQRVEVMEQPDSGQEENRYKDKTTSGLWCGTLFYCLFFYRDTSFSDDTEIDLTW